MLADRIVGLKRNSPWRAGENGDWERFTERLKSAQKFVLSREFSLACDAASGADASKARPFAKLPFPVTWIEFCSADRPSRDIPPDSWQQRTRVVGVLMEQRAENQYMTMVCEAEGGVIDITTFSVYLSPRHDFDVTMVSEYARQRLEQMYTAVRLGLAKRQEINALLAQQRMNWSGEGRFLIWALALLNCRNVGTREFVAGQNAARRRLGRPPLFEHYVLNLRPSGVVGRGAAGGEAVTRAHFVRGHFKARKGGLFWWRAHVRGDSRLGFVSKDYRA